MSTGKIIGIALLAIVGIFAFVAIMTGGSLGLRYFFAEPKGRVEAEEQLESGANRIAKYNMFFDRCARVQSLETKLDAQYAQLENTNPDDDKMRNRVQTNIAGLTGARMEAVRQYNQDARKEYTAARFHSSELPYQLPTHDYDPDGGKTRCTP